MSTALEALFASRVYENGRALRRTSLRHLYLADPPLGIAMWRLGGERFRAAAIAWGPLDAPFKLVVAGEPRNRDLYFAALAPFAADLCARVRRAASIKVERQRGAYTDLIPADALQIVVPNRATVGALRLLGRYLAYLSDRSGIPPDPELIEAGKHLRFYTRHTRVPGQALLIPLDRLVAEHWATLLSPFEQSNLAALDAQIEGSTGVHAFEASTIAEAAARIGPEPTEDIDRVTETLLSEFNSARDGSTDPAVVAPLIGPLRAHYRSLTTPVWQLMGRAVRREQQLPAAFSAARRIEEDRMAFGRHVEWVADGGRYRTRDTPRQAAMTLRRLENALARYEAEKAIDDPACMVPHLLDGDAIRGTVASVKATKVVVRVRAVPRALLVLDTDDPVVQPIGKKLWWTATAGDQHWEVRAVQPHRGGSRAVLMLCARPLAARLPGVGERITFSTLHTQPDGYDLPLQQQPPWTHTPALQPQPPIPIDLGDDQPPVPPVDSTTVPDPGRYA
jgi:hypothetical protein